MHAFLRGAVLSSVLIASTLPASAQDAQTAMLHYRAGAGFLERALYREAAAEFEAFLAAVNDGSVDGEAAEVAFAHYGLGVAHQRLDQLDSAMEHLSLAQARLEPPLLVDCIVLRAHIHARRGQHAEAAALAATIRTSHVTHAQAPAACVLEARSFLQAGQYAQAVAAAEFFLGKWPTDPQVERAHLLKCLSTSALNDPAATTRACEAFATAFPRSALLTTLDPILARSLHATGRLADAQRIYERVAAGESPEALTSLEVLAALALHRGDAAGALKHLDMLGARDRARAQASPMRLLRGRAHHAAGQFQQALDSFAGVAVAESDLRTEALHWAARCEIELGRPKDAAATLELVLERLSEQAPRADALFDLAVAASRAGDHARVLTAVTELRSLSPDHARSLDAVRLEAAALHAAGRSVEAADAIKSLRSRLAPTELSDDVAALEVHALAAAGRDEEVIARAGAWLERESVAEGQERQRVQCQLGLALHRQGKDREAQRTLGPLLTNAVLDPLEPPLYAAALLAMGDMLARAGQWVWAHEFLAGWKNYAPPISDAPQPWLLLALAKSRTDSADEATAIFEQILAQSPNSPAAGRSLFELAQMAIEAGDDEEALARLTACTQREDVAPMLLDIHAQISVIRARQHDLEGAIEHAQRAVALASPETRALHGRRLASLQLDHGDAPAALETLAPFLDAEDADAQTIALGLSAAGRAQESAFCLKLFERLSSHPGFSALPLSKQAVAWYDAAWACRATEQTPKAIACYRAILQLPDEADLHLSARIESADLLLAGDDPSLVRDLLTPVARGPLALPGPRPPRREVVYRLGSAEQKLGNHEASLELLGEFGDLAPDDERTPAANVIAALSAKSLGRTSRVVALLERNERLSHDSPSWEATLLELGDALATMQNWPRSAQVFERILREQPETPRRHQAQFGLGWALENMGRRDEARAQYAAVVTTHRGALAARAQFQIGECWYAEQEFEKAHREFLKVDVLFDAPEWAAAALYEAGRASRDMGQEERAESHFREVASRFPDLRWARLAEEALGARTGADPNHE